VTVAACSGTAAGFKCHPDAFNRLLVAMSSSEILRIASLCVVLAGAETLHGILRTVWLAPKVGKDLAIRLSMVSGTALAFLVCATLVPGIGLQGLWPHLYLGLTLAAFMAAFDVFIGRAIMRFKWSRIWQDFNPASGNYLSVGLLMLVFQPALVWWIRGLLA